MPVRIEEKKCLKMADFRRFGRGKNVVFGFGVKCGSDRCWWRGRRCCAERVAEVSKQFRQAQFHGDHHKIPESFRAFWRIVSFTAANTRRIFEVSVACVRLESR